jgi:hypothetical protein
MSMNSPDIAETAPRKTLNPTFLDEDFAVGKAVGMAEVAIEGVDAAAAFFSGILM